MKVHTDSRLRSRPIIQRLPHATQCLNLAQGGVVMLMTSQMGQLPLTLSVTAQLQVCVGWRWG